MKHIYLDYNATTPMDPKVLEEMLPYFTEDFGNSASGTHAFGWTAKAAVEAARQQVADSIGAEVSEIVFTSGATESINLAIQGVYGLFKNEKNHFITVATEHKAVLDTHAFLARQGAEVTCLQVDSGGQIDLQALENAISDRTALVSVMLANNETGVIHNIQKIAELVHAKKSILFSDCTQALGKMPVNVNELGIDALSLSAHKIYGPKGVGALYLRRKGPRVRVLPMLYGGGHENSFRAGTLNVPGIVGLGKACALINTDAELLRIAQLRRQLMEGLSELSFQSNVSLQNTLVNTLNVFRLGSKASDLLVKTRVLAYSLGSACASEQGQPSHVLTAMGCTAQNIQSTIRISIGRFTTEADIIKALQIFKTAI